MKNNVVYNVLCALLSVLILVNLCFIFANSMKTGETSNAQSEAVADAIKPTVDPGGTIPDNTFQKLVRKSAHFIEFLSLGVELEALSLLFARTRRKDKNPLVFVVPALFAALLSAVLDEFLQSFRDRTSSVSDVLIDFAGSASGILLALAVWAAARFIIDSIRKRRDRSRNAVGMDK